MDFNKLKEAALENGITEIEVYQSSSKNIEVSTFNNVIENNTSSETNVLAIRGVYNNQIVTIYEENANDSMIPSIINKIKDNCSIMNKKEPFFIYPGDKEYPVLVEKENDFDEYTIKQKGDICIELSKLIFAQDECVTNVEVSYSETEAHTSIKNSNGLDVSRNSKVGFIVAEAVCSKDGVMKTGFDYVKINNIKDLDLNTLAANIVKDAMATFGAESIPSGSYKVVLDKKVVSSLIGAFSGIFSAMSVLKNMSFLKDKLGEKIFGDNITLIDDPLSLEAPSQDSFDDEGVASFKKSIVENGVLKTYLHNLKTAAMMNTKSTANGYKSGVSSSVEISPSNLYLQPGDTSLEEMFGKIENGVYITSVQGLHAGLNPISGSFNLQSSGYLIENGVKTKPVTLIILSGKLQEMLNNVEYVGSDFEFKRGVGAPSIAISSMAISGK